MLLSVSAGDNWYRGNWEWRAELFGGTQFAPDHNWFIGLAPHLRYDFATGGRWVPFVDGGAGVMATGIGRPDLSNRFEFNLQLGLGIHRFIDRNVAVTVEARYFNMSDAGMTRRTMASTA